MTNMRPTVEMTEPKFHPLSTLGLKRTNSNASKDSRVHFRDLFLKSDLHGLPDWYEAHGYILKSIWTTILLLSIGCLIYELIHVSIDFRDNPILTTYGVKGGGGLDFPTIYLCTSNPIHETERINSNVDPIWEEQNIHGLLKTHNSHSGLSGILGQKSTISESLNRFRPRFQLVSIPVPIPFPGNPPITTTTTPPPKWVPENVVDYYMKVGYPLETFVQECAWNSEQIPCKTITKEVFDINYGKCYAIAPPEGNNRQKTAGIGLSLVLNLDFANAMSKKSPPLYDGVILKLAHKLDIANEQSTLISPGTYTKVSVSATKMNLIQREREKGGQTCIEEEEGREILKHLNPPIYSSGVCYQDCIQQLVKQYCECFLPVDFNFIRNKSELLCNVEEQNLCAYPSINKHNKTLTECSTSCHVPCNLWQYIVDTSSAVFPSNTIRNPHIFPHPRLRRQTEEEEEVNQKQETAVPEQFNATTNGTSEQPHLEEVTFVPPFPGPPPGPIIFEETIQVTISENGDQLWQRWKQGDMIILDVAFSTLQYIEVTQEPSMTFSTFVSNIGGQVGLWIGASIITMFKFFVILTPLCCARKKKPSISQEDGGV